MQVRLILFFGLLFIFCGPVVLQAAGRVELELVTEQGFPLTGQQDWLRTLGELQFDGLRIRQSTGGEKVEVVRAGSDDSPVYRVTGLLTRGNQLILPGGRFTIRDKSGILESQTAARRRQRARPESSRRVRPFQRPVRRAARTARRTCSYFHPKQNPQGSRPHPFAQHSRRADHRPGSPAGIRRRVADSRRAGRPLDRHDAGRGHPPARAGAGSGSQN